MTGPTARDYVEQWKAIDELQDKMRETNDQIVQLQENLNCMGEEFSNVFYIRVDDLLVFRIGRGFPVQVVRPKVV